MLLVIAIAVVLLALLLASFILTSRRIGAAEREMQSLGAALKQAADALAELKSSVDPLSQRIKISEQSSTYLSDHAQKLEDSLGDLSKKLTALEGTVDDIKSSFSRKVEDLEKTRPEGAPIAEARQMLRDGEDISEISRRTSLPRSEIEMIAKVARIKQKPAEDETMAPAAEGVPAAPAAQEAPARPEPEAGTRHIASLRARNAYGIGQRPGLRRVR